MVYEGLTPFTWRSEVKKTTFLLLASLIFFQAMYGQQPDIYQRPENFERSRNYDVLHYRMEFRFDQTVKRYWGENTITLRSLKDGFQKCKLDAEDFTVSAVTDSDGNPLGFEQSERHLMVSFPNAYSYNQKVSFKVIYEGGPSRYGIKFLDETERYPAQINTYGWPERNHFWFPCYDFPNDRVTHEIIATVKNTDKVLSNGHLMSVTENMAEQTKTFHWYQEQPHPTYLITMIIGPYEIIEDSLGDLPINYWVYKKDVPNAMRSFQKTPQMIAFFNLTFGYGYPWAKYDQICIAGSGGGLENTSATVLGHGTIHDERAEQDFSSEGLVAHELAHQWWGDLITARTWSEVWLSESFATYAEHLWTRYDKGEEEGAINLQGKKHSYLREAHTRYMRPVVFNRYRYPWDIMDAHSYPKGAVILHMLRFVMGDKAFFRSLQHFLHQHALQVVDTHDLKTAIKEATGQNLDWFFEQWIYAPGHPVFKVEYAWDETEKALRMDIHQVQDTSGDIPVYHLPVRVGIVTSEGRISEKLWLKQKEESFTLNVQEKPLMVRFDEGNYLLKELRFKKDKDELLYQLQNDDVIGRMWAADQLLDYREDPQVREALINSAKSDAFWSVRRKAVEILTVLKRTEFIPFFKSLCQDQKSRVRVAAVQALADYQDSDLSEFFLELFKNDDSYLVQAECLTALGKSGSTAQLPFLEEAARMPSPRNVILRAAQSAIKRLKEK